MLLASQITEAGLYTESGLIPLQEILVLAEIIDVTSQVTIRQKFRNDTNKPIEATYCFPLEEDSAVCNFEVTIGGRLLKGVVEEREKAFEDYDEAMASGNAAFLLDQEKTNIFITSVGNLKPEEEAEVSLTYVKELAIIDDEIRLMIPTTVSPRYIPPTADPVSTDRICPPLSQSVPYKIKMELLVREPSQIDQITSPSHKVEVKQLKDAWKVLLSETETELDRDIIINTRLREPNAPFARIQENEKGDRAVMFRIYPEIDQFDTRSQSDVIFLLDCSGSMNGSSIGQAKSVLELCLKSMSEGDRFNIVRFGSTFDILFETLHQYTDHSLKKAVNYARKIRADLGGTELYPALEHIFLNMKPSTNNKCDIIILTDGQVFNEEEVIKLAQQHNNQSRIFSFGIGYGASESLVRGLARATQGMSEFISPDENIEDKVLRQFSRLDTPKLTDVAINWRGLEVQQIPSEIPPIFSGDSLTVYGFIKGGNNSHEITLSYKINEQETVYSAPIYSLDRGDLIPTLWARNYIRELESGIWNQGRSKQTDRRLRTTKKELVKIGKKFQLMSSQTSYVAVETRPDTERTTEDLKYLRVPIQLTKYWHGHAEGKSHYLIDESRRIFSKLSANFSVGLVGAINESSLPSLSSFSKDVPKIRMKQKLSTSWIFDLLKQQTVAGWFELSSKLASQVGTNLKQLKEIMLRIEGAKEKDKLEYIIATALTMLLFELRAKQYKDLWKRSSKKAERVLSKKLGDLTLDGKPLLERLREIFFLERKS